MTENWQTIDEIKAKLDREPCNQLDEIINKLAKCAALLHVAYKSASFESEDYGNEIFNKPIGNGGDAALIEEILNEVKTVKNLVTALNLQLAEGEK